MIIPLRTDSRLHSVPYVNLGLIFINVVVFFLTLNHPHADANFVLSSRQPQLYQFFTYQFLHADWMHIIGNMLFLYIFGNNVNDRLGNVGYLALYLGGGIFAAFADIIASPGTGAGLVGASGSISAVTGAYLVLLPRSNVTVLFFYALVEVASLWFIAGFFVYDIYLNFSPGGDNVAHMAHIGGTLYGFAMCVALLLLRLLPFDADARNLVSLIQHWNRRRQFRRLVASGYNPFELQQREDAARAALQAVSAPARDPRLAQIMEMRAAIANALAAHDLDAAARLYTELKVLDAKQILPRQAQLDIANHLGHQQLYPQAAEAYESFLRNYSKSEQAAQVELILGLIYARYLARPDLAREHLARAAASYHAGRELELAREELARLGPPPFTPKS